MVGGDNCRSSPHHYISSMFRYSGLHIHSHARVQRKREPEKKRIHWQTFWMHLFLQRTETYMTTWYTSISLTFLWALVRSKRKAHAMYSAWLLLITHAEHVSSFVCNINSWPERDCHEVFVYKSHALNNAVRPGSRQKVCGVRHAHISLRKHWQHFIYFLSNHWQTFSPSGRWHIYIQKRFRSICVLLIKETPQTVY